jgi:CheY-like chemotaxis protein
MPKILVVEDSPINQQVMIYFLESKGFECDLATSGAQALTLVHTNEYDLIFLDLRIPNLDGFAAARAIRDTGCSIPIIAVTASALPEDEKNAMDAGMNAFMTKPFSRADFDNAIATWLKTDSQS